MIKLHKLSVSAGNFSLKEISLQIEDGDYFILVGPTGAGKTILLETIAGIRGAQTGEIWSGDRLLNPVTAEKRGISLVYQDCSLFPHLSVKDNIGFGLKIRREASNKINSEVEQMATRLGIQHLLARQTVTLSGGERHKVALARSLVVKPWLLLLDEPFSALDPETRENLRQEIKSIHAELGLTIIHVTHDFEEAMALGRHIAVLDQGQVRQAGTPEQIFRQPNSEFVARFTQMKNIFSGSLIPGHDGYSRFRTENLDMVIPSGDSHFTHAGIRPDAMAVTLKAPTDETINCFTGKITRVLDKGPTLQLCVDVPPEFHCLVTRQEYNSKGFQEGQKVTISFPPEVVCLF